MEVYSVKDNDLDRVPEQELDNEVALENHLVKSKGAEIGSVELLYTGRQETNDQGGVLDLLAVDEQGNTIIIELKRDQAPRDAVAQALDYASSVRKKTYEALDNDFHTFLLERGIDDEFENELPELREFHANYFGLESPLSKNEFNTDQRLVIVGTEFQDAMVSMADFLREHGIDVVCVEYSAYATKDREVELLTTDAIRRPLSDEPSSDSTRERPDYSAFIKKVRTRVFPELVEMVNAEQPDDIFGGNDSHRVIVRSEHSDHPDNVSYMLEPRFHEDGAARVSINVDGGTSELKSRIQSTITEEADEIRAHGIEPLPEMLRPIVQKKMEYGIGPDGYDNDVIDEVAEAYVEMICLFHPMMIERV